MLKTVLVGQDRQHPLQPLVGELHYPAASLADQVLMIRLRRHGLVAFETLAEVMGPHEATLDQKIQGAVDGGGAHPLSPMLQLSADGFDRQVFFGEENDLGYEIALAGDRLTMFPKMTAKALGMGGGFCLIEAGH